MRRATRAAPRFKRRRPSSGAGGGSAPGRGSRSVSCAPAAAGTSAPGAGGARSEPRGPEREQGARGRVRSRRLKVKIEENADVDVLFFSPPGNSPRTAAGRGRSRCCCPAGGPCSGSSASGRRRTPWRSRGGPPTRTPSIWECVREGDSVRLEMYRKETRAVQKGGAGPVLTPAAV